MEHVPHQDEVELSLCSMVYLHNISKPSSYSTHTHILSPLQWQSVNFVLGYIFCQFC